LIECLSIGTARRAAEQCDGDHVLSSEVIKSA
jgi:hypothetical protein